jgi:hypothetical protein
MTHSLPVAVTANSKQVHLLQIATSGLLIIVIVITESIPQEKSLEDTRTTRRFRGGAGVGLYLEAIYPRFYS